jgi:methionyl-tRNA formyltransferase
MKLIFMGTPDFSVPALKALINEGHEILAVYTKAPKPAGRGQKERKSPVHIVAEENNIPVRTPRSLKSEEEQKLFANTGAQMAIVVAYGLILPKQILECCLCINIHASILPRWRGAAPIQRAILAGDSVTGVTIMNMDEGLDTGDMLLWKETPIDENTTAGSLHDKLSEIGSDLIVKYIKKMDSVVPVEQRGGVTYAEKIDKTESKISRNDNVSTAFRKVNAFNPFPGAYFIYDNQKFKVLEANVDYVEHPYDNGSIIIDKLGIALNGGVLYPTKIQRQGKKAISSSDFLRGFSFSKGSHIS